MKIESKTAVVLCNGQPPEREQIVQSLINADLFIAADGGCNTARTMNLFPDIVIGDLDSYIPESSDSWRVIEKPDQNLNDLEKALNYALQMNISKAVVYGATGLRLDHTVKNLSVLKQFHSSFETLFFRDLYCDIKLIDSPFNENLPVQTLVSLFPLSGSVSGVSSKGLKYELSGDTLKNGVFDGSSNQTVAPQIEITFDSGDLLFFVNHKTDSKPKP
jgi:thiamine pyrophosphokinase